MGIVMGQAVDIFLQVTAQITIWLGVLNLLPIPMFDGFTIVRAFLKPQTEEMVLQNQQMIMIIVIILFFTRILAIPVEFLSNYIIKLFYWLCTLPF
jgi:Zn-dependent protease